MTPTNDIEAQAWPGEDQPGRGHRLQDVVFEADEALEWFVLRTATRREVVVEESLLEAGFTVYAPRMARYDRRLGRRIRIERPLVPGYMFIGLPDAGYLDDVLEMEGIHNVLRVFDGSGRPVAVRFEEIWPILQQDLHGEFDRTRRSKEDPDPGAQVTITAGQFRGFPAQFVKRRPDQRIEVLIQMFGRLSSLVVRPGDIEELADDEAA